jgi:hypothetical protein
VLHHSLVFVRYPDERAAEQPAWNTMGTLTEEFLAIYLPGLLPRALPSGTGKLVPRGSEVVIQIHYTSIGYETEDEPRLALYLYEDDARVRQLHARSAQDLFFQIPPYARDHPVQADFSFERDATLYGLMPHMHFRGSRMHYEAFYPDGTSEVLLSVPNYSFNWQSYYELARPKHIPRGTRVHVSGAFDNSAQNPFNPDPAKLVTWGEQSWDEMFMGYLVFAYDEPPTLASRRPSS